MKLGNIHVPDNCRRVSEILARIGDKWTILVVVRLGEGTMRFSELKRSIGSISQRMLTLTLRGLERDGIVRRTVFPTVPPRVDYELTDLGRGLLTHVSKLGEWATHSAPRIETARKAFDRRMADAAE